MSNKVTVGDVYAKVIDEVCAASRVDFEESGVEHGTLDLLKSVWQRKLSQLNVTQLPWDPKPEPAQPAVQNNAKSVPAIPSNGHVNTPPSSNSTPGPQIKQESQPYPVQQAVNAASYPTPQFSQGAPMNAQQRAAMHLHQKYGNQAGTQIAQLQQNQQSRVPVPPGVQQQQPSTTFIKREDGASEGPAVQDFKIDANQASALKTLQTDGPGDEYESEIARRRALIAKHKNEGDRLMRSHFRATQQDLEAGGLLLPLDERLPVIRLVSNTEAKKSGGTTLMMAQGDAAADAEEDEDAINSDLDDPDELENADEQEENVHEVMLCTYDKVQRVKNKWKCTLKDVILRVHQQEYVFNKGQGEFEW